MRETLLLAIVCSLIGKRWPQKAVMWELAASLLYVVIIRNAHKCQLSLQLYFIIVWGWEGDATSIAELFQEPGFWA